MSNWTSERRKRQSELIQQWRPWEKSTGPTSEDGKSKSARNVYKGGAAETKAPVQFAT